MIQDLNSIDLFFWMLFDGNNCFDNGSANLNYKRFDFHNDIILNCNASINFKILLTSNSSLIQEISM